MSASKRINFAVAVSWLSRAVTILANLFLIPILFRYMGKEALGLWFLLGNSQAFLSLLGMGIEPTLTRQIALAKGKSGADPEVELTEESKQHIGDLVVTGRTILQWLSVAVFLIAWVSGYALISQLKLQEVSPQTVFWAWTLMCAGYAVGIWVSYLNSLLMGIGYVGLNSLMSTALALLTIMANIGAVMLGGGLLALAAISVVANLVQRFAILGFIHKRKHELLTIQGKWNATLAKSMVKLSLHSWLTTLGTFLILKTDQYFIALASGTKDIPSYHAAYQLASNLRVLAVSFAISSAPFLGQMWQAGDLNKIHKIVINNCRISLLIMACGTSFLLISGKELTSLWLGNDVFIGYKILATFCIMLTFEVQNVCLIYSARATGNEEYAISSLAAGVLNIGLTMILIKPLGLWGVSLATLLSLMLTNNWYALYKPLLRLKLNLKEYINKVVMIWLLSLVLSLFLGSTIKYLLSITNYNYSWLTLITSAIVSGVIFLIGIRSTVFIKKSKSSHIAQ
ncbi:MAG: oligosaccharide flippase family protein [Symploca sp. SIO3C6]|uniref:Oligosaccharide flippase family protein n=1 Tax=Symploca sp. SIO1C4 TaxID=2607765 RepID=A0A6B3NA24_9CYAN|nr:oligosaccharide flippase family protein [Symploca sp. SIO3C6]NER26924.1 oligosaccharide flippase family protein [Symploca sp. SIO1C4]NET07878.1 oligosaccharide flippase family protein [Symploca sp. SIO2B6]